MIGSNVTSEMSSSTTTDVEFLQGQHTNVTLNSGNVSGDIAVNILDFDYTAGTLQGDFAYLQIQNDPVPTPSSGTARAINSDSTLPSHFSGQVEVPLIPTSNPHATSKQYVDTQIASIPAGLVFQGNWDANANSPTLASGVGTVGNYYVVSVPGNTNLDGITDWEVGDWAVFVEVGGVDKWDKIDQTFVQGSGATGQVTFWNSINAVTGDNAFFWDNTNKRLGIGTTTPQRKLHLHESSSGGSFIAFTNDTTGQTSTDGAIVGLDGDEDLLISTYENKNIEFRTGNTERMRIDSSGNVGIGTTSPGEKFSVKGDASYMEITHPTATSFSGIKFSEGGTPQGSIQNIGSTFATVARRGNFEIFHNTSGNLTLQHNGGNVGIGTTSPAAALDVVGRIGLNDGNNNVSIGDSAGDSITSGDRNTLVGYLAGTALTTGQYNVAIGYESLENEDTGSRAVAIGYQALYSQNYNGSAYNVAIGFQAGYAVTTGIRNTLIGGLAGDALTTGTDNVAIGYGALSTEDGNGFNTAIGTSALQTLNAGADAYNVAVGYHAGVLMTTGIQNTIIGGLAGDALTTGTRNIAIGFGALSAEDSYGKNVAIGAGALNVQDAGADAYNVAIGDSAGGAITTGIFNNLIGGIIM
jgi:hypothetical protein